MSDLLRPAVEVKPCGWWVAAEARFCGVDAEPEADATGTAACAKHVALAQHNVDAIGGTGAMPAFNERLGPTCGVCGAEATYLLPDASAFTCDGHIPEAERMEVVRPLWMDDALKCDGCDYLTHYPDDLRRHVAGVLKWRAMGAQHVLCTTEDLSK